jgi:hypothetical protein
MGFKERSAAVLRTKVEKWIEECKGRDETPMEAIDRIQHFVSMTRTLGYRGVQTTTIVNRVLLSILGDLARMGTHAVVEHLLEAGEIDPEDIILHDMEGNVG